jgi:acyl carrier protein
MLNTQSEVVQVLDTVLGLGGRVARFTRDTPLLGAVPELDSMAVVSLLAMLEERFGFVIEDDEIDSQTFATLGNLVEFVDSKVAA